MPGINNQDKKSKLLALLCNPQFQEKVIDFRLKWGIPAEGFRDFDEDYKNWVLSHIDYEESLRHDFEMIVKRCYGLYSKIDPIFSAIISTHFLFNKFLSNYSNELHLPVLPKIRNSGVLGYVDIVFPLPMFFNFSTVQEIVKSSEGFIKGATKNIEDSVKVVLDTSIHSFGKDDIQKSFLLTTPGNPHDIIAKTQEYTQWLVEFGRALLRNSSSKIKNPVIKEYKDKNAHIDYNIQRIGDVLSNRQLYPIVEFFWSNITDEIEIINKEKGWKLNRGISLANTGVYQIAQGKVDEGLFNLYRAFNDDKEILEKLNDPRSNPEFNIVSTILFTQFENPLLDWLYYQALIPNSNLVDIVPKREEISRFVESIAPDVRLSLFNTLWSIKQGVVHTNILSNFIDRGRLISALGGLCLWVENMMRRKNQKIKNLYNGLSFLKFTLPNGFVLRSESLDDLENKIKEISKILNKDQQNALLLILIRNYSSHNFETKEHEFFISFNKYLASIIYTILLAAANGKL